MMKPYQQRVVEEREDLDARREKLKTFLESDVFNDVPPDEQGRLKAQALVMEEYSLLLESRILHFS